MQFDNNLYITNHLGSLKVLQLGKFHPVRGGVEKVMYDLMEGLSTRGLACDMLCAAESGPTSDSVVNPKAKLLRTHTLRKIFGTMISPAMIGKLRSICQDYDIIHVHHPDPMACVALLFSGYKGRVIVHWHSDIIKQHRMLKAYKPLQNWMLRRADLIVCTSQRYLDGSDHLKHFVHKCRVLPIGIKPMQADAALTAEIAQKYQGKKLVYALGRLVPYKGFKYLIDAACLLPDNYHVVIGGDGPLRKQLQKQIDDNRLKDKVELLGYLPDEVAAAYFAACDVFCLPSIYKTEAFGIVQLEAMSLGKPVVATRIPGSGVSWVNAQGVSGSNAPLENAPGLARAILEVTANAEDQERYAAGARKRYEDHFTFDEMISGALEIYNELIENQNISGKR